MEGKKEETLENNNNLVKSGNRVVINDKVIDKTIVTDSIDRSSEEDDSKGKNLRSLLVKTKSTYKIRDVGISDEVKERIQKELIDTSYYRDVSHNIKSKSRWKYTADVAETIGKLISYLGIIASFAAGSFNYINLAFAAGTCGIVGEVLSRFSSYAMQESSERTAQVNKILEHIGIDKIVDITIDSTNV